MDICFLPTLIVIQYHPVMTNIAMENRNHKWRFLARNIIYFYGPFSMAMLNNQRVGFMDKQNVRCQNSWIIYGSLRILIKLTCGWAEQWIIDDTRLFCWNRIFRNNLLHSVDDC